MLFLRTAAGGFVNAATIVRLVEDNDGDEIRQVAICEGGREVVLASYYSAPGRLRELQKLVSRQDTASRSQAAPVKTAYLPTGCCVL